MKVLIVGHPRSGTRFASQCFQNAGWNVGHEELLLDGISSWMWAVDSKECPWGTPRNGQTLPDIRIHILRNPANCIASIVGVERGSELWRSLWIKLPQAGSSVIERAVWSLYRWSKLIRENVDPTLTVKTEALEAYVENITGVDPGVIPFNAMNIRPHRPITADEIKATSWVHGETATYWNRINSDYAGAAA